MKRIFPTMALSAVIAISVFLPPKDSHIAIAEPPPVQVEVIGVPPKLKADRVQYYLMVYDEFKNEPTMLKIAMAESGFNPLAKNPHSTASGLFQILKGTWAAHKCTGDVFNPHDNIQCARKIYNDSGFSPWDASKDNWS